MHANFRCLGRRSVLVKTNEVRWRGWLQCWLLHRSWFEAQCFSCSNRLVHCDVFFWYAAVGLAAVVAEGSFAAVEVVAAGGAVIAVGAAAGGFGGVGGGGAEAGMVTTTTTTAAAAVAVAVVGATAAHPCLAINRLTVYAGTMPEMAAAATATAAGTLTWWPWRPEPKHTTAT